MAFKLLSTTMRNPLFASIGLKIANPRNILTPVAIFSTSDKSAILPTVIPVSTSSEDSNVTISGMPKNQIGRRVIISKPARNVMQSGTAAIRLWKIEFEASERWENPLIGWGSTGDVYSNMEPDFHTKEAAVDFAIRNGWTYEIREPFKPKTVKKSYSANFSWNKRTRVTNK